MPIGPLLNRIVENLTKRRDALDRAIIALQELAATEGPRRGRRPKILQPPLVQESTPTGENGNSTPRAAKKASAAGRR